MNMMEISRKANQLAVEVGKFGDLKREHVIELAKLVAELASSASSATDPRLYDRS